MTTDWANLEGLTVQDLFPLLRLLGSSERSAVFLSRAAKITPADIAVKLVPAVPGHTELLLQRWRSAAALDHLHLLRLFEVGECELGGQRYLYSVMEYAEENLAQLLERRALVPEEVREMLGPILDALEFLHGSKRVHGGLKPSNILVVGELVKLASDAIGPTSDVASNGTASATGLSPYLPPEAAGGARSTAGDIWALGVTTCEALSLRKPAGLHAVGGGIALPADLPPGFRDMISKCLSRRPEDRPDVARLQAWRKGGELAPMPAPTPTPAPTPEQEADLTIVAQAARPAASTRLVIRAELVSPDEITEPGELKSHWRPVRVIAAAAVLLLIAGAGIYFFSSGETPAVADAPGVAPGVVASAPQPPAPSSQEPAAVAPATEVPTARDQAPVQPAPQAPATKVSATSATASDSSFAVNEVIPVVPRSASQTIRGTVRVSVRVIVDDTGNVVAATSEDPGPSRYFERLSLEAAKQWMFMPAESGGKRLMLVKFNYTRSGATAKALPAQ